MQKILIALTSHGSLGDTGRPTGFYVPEAAHPYRVFTAAGYEVDFVSVQGGRPPRDGVKPGDTVTANFLADLDDRLSTTPAAGEADPAEYDAVFFAGGHGTMWDFPDCEELSKLAAEVYQNGGVVAAVCHGPAALVNLRLADGEYLVRGKRVTSFTNEEETAAGLMDVVPFALETGLLERGAEFTKTGNFAEHAVADRRLVTGQNPASATMTAELVLAELGARR